MNKAEFQKRRTEIISKMLENPKDGIYPTTECFNELDSLFDAVNENENWGVGKRKDEKAFDTVMVGDDKYELIHGEHPHSRQDNTTYARDEQGRITGFDGHRLPFKIVIEEFNYYKSSGLSGDEIRKGGNVKVFCNGVQVLDEFTRSYEHGYFKAHKFIMDMEWSWFPKDCAKKIGKIVGYNEQLFKIERFVVDQGCMILATLDGKPRKRWLWEHEEDHEPETTIKVEVNAPGLTWFPVHDLVKEGQTI